MQRPDRDAFARLVREHHAAVYRSAVRVLRRPACAEDVTQQVFLRVLEGRLGLAGGDADRGVLCWHASRLALNELRGARRRERNERSAAMTRPEDPPSNTAEQHEQHRVLQQSLDALPDEYRLPLVLRFGEGATFAAVGDALRVSESTAHERVRRGLEKLRRAMTGADFALAPARLELMLGEAVPQVPPSLEGSLLALGKPALALGLPAKLAAAVVLLGAAGVTIAVLDPWRPAEPTAVREATSGELPRTAGDPTPSAAESRSAVPGEERGEAILVQRDATPGDQTGRITGTVRDAQGFPVADAEVRAATTDSAKAPARQARTTTDAAGGFALDLPIPAARESIEYALAIASGARVLHRTESFAVRAGVDGDHRHVTLPASAGDATQGFALTVRVARADGEPVAEVPVKLYLEESKVAPGGYGALAEAQTDASGSAVLRGNRHGGKLVFVDGRQHGGRAEVVLVHVDRAAPEAMLVTLQPGRTLRGSIAMASGGVPEHPALRLTDDDDRMTHEPQVGADGSFAFTGLDEGSYTLGAWAWHCSPIELRGVRAGDEAIALRCKREDDPRDVGMHMGEVHGRVRDARTGEFLKLRCWDVEALPLGEGDSTLLFDLVQPRMAQQAESAPAREAFHLTGLAPGRHAVVASFRGFAPELRAVTIAENEIHAGLTIDLQPGGTVRGNVVDGLGAPVGGAMVFVVGVGAAADAALAAWDEDARRDERQRRYPSLLAASCRADAQGGFVLRDVPTGVRLRVAAVHERFAAASSAAVVLEPGGAEQTVRLGVIPR